MSEPRASTRTWADEMNVIASQTTHLIKAGRQAGLTNEAATLAVLIGAFSVMRADMLNENELLKTAREGVPHRMQREILEGKPLS